MDFTTWLQPDHRFDLPGLKPVRGARLRELTPAEIQSIFESYTLAALETACKGRALPVEPKLSGVNRARHAAMLAAVFNNPTSITQVLKELSPATRYGLALLKASGGIVNRAEWLQKVGIRYGLTGRDQAEQELIGKALAIYGTLHHSDLLFVDGGTKQAIAKPGFQEAYLAVFPAALSLFVEGQTLAELLNPPLPHLYKGQDVVALRPANPASFEPLLQDLFSFVRYLENINLKLLQSGDPAKKDFSKLYALMSVKDLLPLAEARKLSELPRLEFLWQLLLTSELVIRQTTHQHEIITLVHTARVAEFLALPRLQQVRSLVMAWIGSAYNDFLKIPSLSFISNDPVTSDLPAESTLKTAREFVVGLLETLVIRHHLPTRADQWLELSSFQNYVQELNYELLVSRRERPTPSGYYYYYKEPKGYFGRDYYNGYTSRLQLNNSPWSREGRAAVLDRDWKLVEGEWLVYLIGGPMAWLGLTELGLNQASQTVAWKLTDLGLVVLGEAGNDQPAEGNPDKPGIPITKVDLERSLIVQPNLEVLALAPLEHMAVLHQLDRFASQESFGEVARYRLSKESVLKGLRTGLTGGQILDFLTTHSRVPLSQNLITSIQDWNNSFERLLLRPAATLLEVPDPAVLDQLMGTTPGGASIIEKRLSPTLALLKTMSVGEPGLTTTQLTLTQPTASLNKPASRNGPQTNIAKPQVGSKPANGARETAGPLSSQNLAEILAGTTQNGKPSTRQPVILDYRQIKAGAVQLEGESILKVKLGSGSPYLYYRLGQFADLLDWEPAKQTARFELTSSAGVRAQRLGLTYLEVAQFLTEWCGLRTVLPTATRLRVKNWLGYYPTLTGYRSLSLKAVSPEQLDELFSLSEFAPLLIERASARVALIHEELLPEYQARLTELGVLIKLQN